jgi:hypothetical protein
MLSANFIGAMFINAADPISRQRVYGATNEPGPLAPPAKWKTEPA